MSHSSWENTENNQNKTEIRTAVSRLGCNIASLETL